MMSRIQVILILLLIYFNFPSTLDAQPTKLFEWVVPLEYSTLFNAKVDPYDIFPSDTLYLSKNKHLFTLDLKSERISRLPIEFEGKIHDYWDERWIQVKNEDGLDIIDRFSLEKLETDFDIIDHAGGLYFAGMYNDKDSVYIFKWKDPAFKMNLRNIGLTPHVFAGKNYIYHDNNQKEGDVEVYDSDKNLLFRKEDAFLKIISDQHLVFRSLDRSLDKHLVVDKYGRNIYEVNRRRCLLMYFHDIDKGIKIECLRNGNIYLDYEGNPIDEQLMLPTLHENIFTIENCKDAKVGVYFKKQKKTIDCLYDKVVVPLKWVSYGRRDIVVAERAGIKDIYTLDGKLLSRGDGYAFTRHLRNQYIIVAKGGKCGIVDSANNVMFPFTIRAERLRGLINDPCWGTSFRFKDKDFFLVRNPEGHVFIRNNKDDHVISFTGGDYGGKLGNAQDFLLLSKGSEDSKMGIVWLKTGEIILPFQYVHIYANPYEDGDYSEYVILDGAGSGNYSLFHLPSRKILLDNFQELSFKGQKYISARKHGKYGVIKLMPQNKR